MSGFVNGNTEAYLTDLFPQNDVFLRKMESFAAEKHIPIIEPPCARFLDIFIRSVRPESYLEIGMAIGYSAIIAAKAMPANNKVYSIEKSNDSILLASKFIKEAGLSERIVIMEGEAKDILRSLNSGWGFIFLDADKEDYQELFKLALPLLKDGGIMLIDNLLWHGYTASDSVPDAYQKSTNIIREFNRNIVSGGGYQAAIITVGDGLGIVIKNN